MAAKKRRSAGPGPSPSGQDKLISDLKQFIRTRGPGFLSDPNVSSIGIGYKEKNGKRGKELALQFTVDKKVRPEGLDELRTAEIPATIDIGGVPVPTDVVQRTYKPHFLVVAEGETPQRQKRVDPVRPGVSVGNIKVTAGTFGCIAFDRNDGSPCVLSNWHVLNGRKGELGDVVVQPGTADDSRIAMNRLGRLKRAHLGRVGDCAVSTVTDREFTRDILDLDVTPTKLGEPQIDDKVVKSGRTTGVTHGLVRRPFALVGINYGGSVGVREIECFEIGPDPRHPADGDEISLTGDSGSVWMFTTRSGRPTDVMAGLHFGGEGDGDPEDRALACFPQAVFDELKITLVPPDPESLEALTGYDPGFLAVPIGTPQLNPSIKEDAVRINGSEVIPYTHFSLALSTSRRFAVWVAWNIDGGTLKKLDRKGIGFAKDPRLPAAAQVSNELYKGRNNRLDRGHIARRADVVWGSLPEAKKANKDSFFYTNITPQMDDFNQSGRNGIWGHLEDAVFEDVRVDELKVSAFGGPVFHEDDRVFRGVKLPREFWKVLVFSESGKLKCKAFLLTQNLEVPEALELDEFRVFQVKLSEIRTRTHLRFPDAMTAADTLMVPESVEDRTPLERQSDIDWS
ncbi:DNA/RNA non-specific endonuclease [Streptomyces pristinaespiralis]|uniref:DNA/RNA endonuclease n=2 Tax=Streptomyces pristinaespiralis TaxID=38300 RepID=B5HG21_STRE2|nr:DNA/RNA non-specific endonuclease [Streptomyces pristinaespiralis]ALC19694.1 endonuclease [Streptomyces pristinaespiralis]EDY65782.2 DNA/RNA endonuclease [Streptomyces pristinaespiralis ATCC 25486]QMU17317.1 DNA/RNA non-specific endonuclease [Streptomyces pristinaespiralis]